MSRVALTSAYVALLRLGIDIDKELESASLVSAVPIGAPAEEKKAEAPKKEEKKEAAAEGLSALFG